MTQNLFPLTPLSELKQIRIDLNISLETAGKYCNVSRDFIRKFENGKKVSIENFHEIYEDFLLNAMCGKKEISISTSKKYTSIRNLVDIRNEIKADQVLPLEDNAQILKARTLLSISQEKLAQLADVPASMISFYERKKSVCPISRYKKIMHALKQEKLRQIFGSNHKEENKA